MGKSIRSKAKRSFRAKKREDSVYAAVHAARLNRLNRKLKDITMTDKEGDLELDDVDELEAGRDGEGRTQGWCSYLLLGVVDPEGITADTGGDAVLGRGGLVGSCGSGVSEQSGAVDAADLFPHLFPDAAQSCD